MPIHVAPPTTAVPTRELDRLRAIAEHLDALLHLLGR